MNAPEKALEIKAAVTAAIALVGALLGTVGIAVLIFLACMILDYITGSLAAKAHGEWSSKIAREGLWHKLGEIAALLVAALCDIAIKEIILSTPTVESIAGPVNYAGYLTLIVCAWYILTELGSILENIAKLGAPVPKWMIEGIGKMKKKIDKQQTDKLEDVEKKDDAAGEKKEE